MGTHQVNVVVAVFQDPAGAKNVLKNLNDNFKPMLVSLKNMTVLRKDEHGHLHIQESEDMSGNRGAIVGGAIGGVLGLLAGPGAVIVGAAGAALAGGLVAKFHDAGFKNDRLKEIGLSLKPNSSLFMAAVIPSVIPGLEKVLVEAGGEVVTSSFDNDLIEKLEADILNESRAPEGVIIEDKVDSAKNEFSNKEDLDRQKSGV